MRGTGKLHFTSRQADHMLITSRAAISIAAGQSASASKHEETFPYNVILWHLYRRCSQPAWKKASAVVP